MTKHTDGEHPPTALTVSLPPIFLSHFSHHTYTFIIISDYRVENIVVNSRISGCVFFVHWRNISNEDENVIKKKKCGGRTMHPRYSVYSPDEFPTKERIWIGQGASSVVYKYTNPDGLTVCLKEISRIMYESLFIVLYSYLSDLKTVFVTKWMLCPECKHAHTSLNCMVISMKTIKCI